MQAGEQGSPGVSKWDIRKKIWDYMEEKNLADFPRPVHHRIPNFKGSSLMCHSIQKCDVFHKAREVKVDPDKPLEGIRLAVLQARKTLLVPTPRLRTGLFNKIVPPPGATKDTLRKCATSQGVKDYSVPVGLDAKVQIDLVVVGSVAVSEKGYRIGKGEGFADMEYAMMVSMGAIREDTVVITAVHDCQVVDIPEKLLGDHDLTVDCILTPTRVIETGCKSPKPQGILWHKISHEMLDKIPILKNLRYREQERGKDTTLKDDQPAVSTPGKPGRAAQKTRLENTGLQNETGPTQARPGEGSSSDQSGNPDEPTTVYVGNIPQGTRVTELKEALRKCGATPTRLTWQGAQHRAFLSYISKPAAELALKALQGLSLGGHALRIELARNQHNRMASRP
ncbi:methenyltetrahydrofolate synthase domain-containing protein isoform X1 [Tiliqua scincoides]|uniref:methenyltetrahydrofolate synthase domain-containing protein isoform X1 n=1 Tax=Tiliqua scincoides TaxID=71010 RepID=UPI003462720F